MTKQKKNKISLQPSWAHALPKFARISPLAIGILPVLETLFGSFEPWNVLLVLCWYNFKDLGLPPYYDEDIIVRI